MRSHIMNFAKGAAYVVLWLACAVTLVRGVVGPLWGSASDYGLAGAVLALVGGILGLAWLAGVMLADLNKGDAPKTEKTDHE